MKMNKYYIRFLTFVLLGVLVLSCEDNDIPTVDIRNGRAIAGFNAGSETVIFNPSADTDNILTVGVSTISDQDRQVSISIVDSLTTLDQSYYEIENFNPIIPAGEFTTDVLVKTIASANLPSSSAKIALKLNSVENAEILPSSISSLSIGINVQCPEVDNSAIAGTYQIVRDDFEVVVGDGEVDIVEGPEDNQFTINNIFGHANPNAGGAMNYNIVISIDPESGAIKVEKQDAWHCSNIECTYGQGRIEGSGNILTCINQINLRLEYSVDAGNFGTYALTLEK